MTGEWAPRTTIWLLTRSGVKVEYEKRVGELAQWEGVAKVERSRAPDELRRRRAGGGTYEASPEAPALPRGCVGPRKSKCAVQDRTAYRLDEY